MSSLDADSVATMPRMDMPRIDVDSVATMPRAGLQEVLHGFGIDDHTARNDDELRDLVLSLTLTMGDMGTTTATSDGTTTSSGTYAAVTTATGEGTPSPKPKAPLQPRRLAPPMPAMPVNVAQDLPHTTDGKHGHGTDGSSRAVESPSSSPSKTLVTSPGMRVRCGIMRTLECYVRVHHRAHAVHTSCAWLPVGASKPNAQPTWQPTN